MKVTQPKIAKEKILRTVFRILFVLVGIISPIAITSYKYKLVTKFNGTKLTVIAILLIILTVWRLKNKIYEWIKSWEYSLLKYVLIGFSKVYIFVIAVILIALCLKECNKLLWVFQWVCLFECVAYMIIYPLEQHYDFIIKREIRKQETRETNAELIEEIKNQMKG